jgi:hypothetical protein
VDGDAVDEEEVDVVRREREIGRPGVSRHLRLHVLPPKKKSLETHNTQPAAARPKVRPLESAAGPGI